METIRGKMSQYLDCNGLWSRLENYERVLLDLGTGDGRYVRTFAEQQPDWFVIGVDACRENLRAASRIALPNALFLIANAQALPQELYGSIAHVTINFPWGSLLKSLLTGEAALMSGLTQISKPQMAIDIYLNGGALAEAGFSLETGTQCIYEHMNRHGWNIQIPYQIDCRLLQKFPTTCAKRLAYGRDPRAMALRGTIL